MKPTTSIAVALGAGGMLASLQHLALIAALADLGYGLEDAELVVATSAGASIGARTLVGQSLEQLTLWATTPPSSQQRTELRRALTSKRSLKPTSTAIAAAAIRSRSFWPGLAAGLLPNGRLPTMVMGLGVHEQHWPPNLVVCATRLPDGTRHTFDQSSRVSLGDAIEASSSVPGVFVPKTLPEGSFVDGAVASSNSADLAVQSHARLVIISSVQTRAGRSPLRSAARRQLQQELEGRDPASIVVLEPTPAELALARGFPLFNKQNATRLVDVSKDRILQRLSLHVG